MKQNFVKTLFLILTLSLGTQFGSAQPVDIHQILSKGINFDHIFAPHRRNATFEVSEYPDLAMNLKTSEFEQVAKLGFTHVRLNLGRYFLQDSEPPFNLMPQGLALLDQAVSMAVQNGLGIVLDMHQTPTADIFHDPKALEAFQKLWQGLAAHYAGQSPLIIYELMNEPAVPEFTNGNPKPADWEKWREIIKGLVGTIRREDPDHYIVVTAGGWGGLDDLMQMGSLGLPRLVYSFHYYLPFVFTHQGAEWMDPSLARLHDIHYPVTGSEVKAGWEKAKKAGNQEWPFRAVPQGFDKKDMQRSLEALFQFAQKENLMLYCGEFGVHKPVAPPADRARWIKDMADILKEHGVAWSMWAYHAGFDLVDELGNPDPNIVKALGLQEVK